MACVFAAAFIWVAVEFFDVDVEVVWRFFLGSLLLVVSMMALALVFSLVLWRLRRNRSSFLNGPPDDEDKC